MFWPKVLSAVGPLEESGACALACVIDSASAVASALAATVRVSKRYRAASCITEILPSLEHANEAVA